MSHRPLALIALTCVLALAACRSVAPRPVDAGEQASSNPPAPGFDAQGSDAQAIEIADRVMRRLGGREAWDQTRYVSFRFFGSRSHVWDRLSGDVRIEQDGTVILMNVHTKSGRVFEDGTEVVDEDALAEALQGGHAAWINDTYWLLMPYKLKDTGVTLAYGGDATTEEGRPAHLLTLTFRETGLTPDNKYDVWVDRETDLVTQWAFYPTAADPEPRFTTPWSGWIAHGPIWLSGGRGIGELTEIKVFDELPREVFTSSRSVRLGAAEAP